MIRLFVLPVLIMHCSVPSVFLFSADYSCSAQHYGGGASGWEGPMAAKLCGHV